MIVKIIKLPFKAVAAVLAVALMALHFVGAIALGLSARVKRPYPEISSRPGGHEGK